MNTSQELIEIWHFLEEQEIRLIELDRRLRALLETIRTNASLFDSYRTTYERLGNSNLILTHDRTVRAIDEKVRQLSI
jgi:hypothetical protein